MTVPAIVSDEVSTDAETGVRNTLQETCDNGNVPVHIEEEHSKSFIKQKNYILNDIAALKKKLLHEKRKIDIQIEKEAKDFSNVVMPMRASFFEHVKAHFIQDLMVKQGITSVDNAKGAKAVTELCGDAFVEYSLTH